MREYVSIQSKVINRFEEEGFGYYSFKREESGVVEHTYYKKFNCFTVKFKLWDEEVFYMYHPSDRNEWRMSLYIATHNHCVFFISNILCSFQDKAINFANLFVENSEVIELFSKEYPIVGFNLGSIEFIGNINWCIIHIYTENHYINEKDRHKIISIYNSELSIYSVI